jgi:hypothetical protein
MRNLRIGVVILALVSYLCVGAIRGNPQSSQAPKQTSEQLSGIWGYCEADVPPTREWGSRVPLLKYVVGVRHLNGKSKMVYKKVNTKVYGSRKEQFRIVLRPGRYVVLPIVYKKPYGTLYGQKMIVTVEPAKFKETHLLIALPYVGI